MKFRTIVADPPWTYRSRGFADGTGTWALGNEYGERRSKVAADERYPTLTLDEVCVMPVTAIADDDAYLWLWIPSEHFRHGDHLAVCEAWGFVPKGERVWRKPWMGMGYWLRYNHEYLLFATRGSPGDLRRRDLVSCVDATVPDRYSLDRPSHSVKPERFYRDIEDACSGPYLELFARRPRPDQLDLTRDNVEWTVWGNEVGDPLGIGFDPAKWKPAA